MLKSHRDIPLVLQEAPSPNPLLTVENYCKWYDVFIVFPDGRVEIVDYNLFWDGPGTGWHDHVPNPKACLGVAAKLNVEWHGESFEMIVGRYMLEVQEDKFKKLLGITDVEWERSS